MSLLDKAANFFGSSSHDPIIVHEAEEILAELRRIRLDAPEVEHRGLDTALAVVELFAQRTDRQRISAWVRHNIGSHNSEPLDRVQTVKKIRELFPAIGLADAAKLADEAIANAQDESA